MRYIDDVNNKLIGNRTIPSPKSKRVVGVQMSYELINRLKILAHERNWSLNRLIVETMIDYADIMNELETRINKE